MRCGQRKREGKTSAAASARAKSQSTERTRTWCSCRTRPVLLWNRHSPSPSSHDNPVADVGDGTRPYGGLWERAWLTDTKECYERRRGTCFHFVSNVKSRARGSDDDRELRGSPEPCFVSFVLKMCEFMVLQCRPQDIFKMAARHSCSSFSAWRTGGECERDGQILSFVLPSI